VSDDETVDPPSRPLPPIVALILGIAAAAALGFSLLSHEWLYAGSTQLQYRDDGGMSYAVGPVHEMAMGLRGLERCSSDGKVCEAMSSGELLAGWERELMRARILAEEPVEAEARALLGDTEYAELVRRRELEKTVTDPAIQLELAQKNLILAKRVYAASSSWSTFGLIAYVAILIAVVSLLVAVGIVGAGKRVRLPIMPTTTALLGVAVALVVGCLFVALKPGPPGYVGVGLGFFAFGGGVVLGLWSALALNKLMRPHDPDLLEDAMKADEF